MNLAERLAPQHVPSLDDLKRETDATLAPVDKPDPRRKRRYSFAIRYESPEGEVLEGTFTNEILNVGKQQAVGVLEAKLNGLLPVEAIDGATRALNHATAHMEYSLVERPEWAKDMRNLLDDALYLIFEEVAGHENFFRRPRASEG